MALTPSEIRTQAARLATRCRLTGKKGFRLKDFDPRDTAGLDEECKEEARGGPGGARAPRVPRAPAPAEEPHRQGRLRATARMMLTKTGQS
jgi:hypothetical protein